MTQPSPLYMLLEERLGRPLTQVVAELRATKSWPEIARAISDEAGVELNSETLRRWFADRVEITTTVRVA